MSEVKCKCCCASESKLGSDHKIAPPGVIDEMLDRAMSKQGGALLCKSELDAQRHRADVAERLVFDLGIFLRMTLPSLERLDCKVLTSMIEAALGISEQIFTAERAKKDFSDQLEKDIDESGNYLPEASREDLYLLGYRKFSMLGASKSGGACHE